jgi:uncharacterized protein YecE (DUF72 family)
LRVRVPRVGVSIYAYFDNHYAGFSPASIHQLFRNLAAELGLENPLHAPASQPSAQPLLF